MKAEEHSSSFDFLKWLIILLLVGFGVWANYFFAEIAFALRLSGWLVLLCVVLAIAALTDKGRNARGFMHEARIELKKVIWPTRQETLQTTLIVAAMVTLIALVIWGFDSFLLWFIGMLTGQRG